MVFKSVPPESISQYDSIVIQAAYIENGIETDQPLEWYFDGADSDEVYCYQIAEDGRSVEITCISPSDNNLEITASKNGHSITATIELLGY